MLAMNIGHCLIANDLGFELHAGYSFNLCNSAALDEVKTWCKRLHSVL